MWCPHMACGVDDDGAQPDEVAKHPEEVLDVLNFHMMGGPPKKKALPSNSQLKSDKAKVRYR